MFGFGDDYEEIGIDATVQPRNQLTQSVSCNEPGAIQEPTPYVPTIPVSKEIPGDLIFEHVVEIFNSALPEFLAKSVDPAAQRKLLFDSLDESIKEYILRLAEEANRESELRWQTERNRLLSEIDSHKEKAHKAEENQSESKNRQLSAERQKRALTERIHDLESQVTRLEAEHEQFELENKSLINKIRVSSIQEGDNDALKEEIAHLKQQLADAMAGKAPISNESSDEAERLKEENKVLANDIELLKAKQELDDAMVKDLNAIAAEAKQQLKEKEEEIASLSAALNELKASRKTDLDRISVAESELIELRNKLTFATDELQSTREELDSANQNLAVAEEIQSRIERFEDIKARKDAKIAELQQTKDKMLERERILKNECSSLKRTIEQNLRLHAQSEAELRARIEKLEAEKISNPAEEKSEDIMGPVPTPKPRQKRKKKEIKISAIDESLDNTDWLIATPPEGTTLRQSGNSDSNSTFGYQEPSRKTPPENEAQMSLW